MMTIIVHLIEIRLTVVNAMNSGKFIILTMLERLLDQTRISKGYDEPLASEMSHILCYVE